MIIEQCHCIFEVQVIGYDDEDNIVRDVEEDEGKRVAINMAVEEDDDDTKYYWLLYFPISHMLKLAQLRCESYEALRIAVIHQISLHQSAACSLETS